MSAVALIGAPGSGKSTVGRLLAARLGLPFTDVDARIEAEQGKLVREIFADSGEAYFRELERVATLDALAAPGVVSLGGGAPMNPDIAAALQELPTVWLQVSVGQVVKRIRLDEGRPLLAGNLRATLIRLLNERTPTYQSVARYTIDTDGLTAEQIADALADKLKDHA